MNAKRLTFTALLTAILCVCAPWSIPAGAVPITLATFAVYLISSVINWRYGCVAVLLYIILGTAGLPVFSGFSGGVTRLAGVTGGFLMGYLPCALVIGVIIDRFEDKKWIYPLAMIAGTLCCYAFGTVWFIIQSGSALSTALAACVLPFLLGDALKIAAASAAAILIRPRLKRFLTPPDAKDAE